MIVGEACVDNEVYILLIKKLAVVGKGNSTEIAHLGNAPSALVVIDDVLYVIIDVALGEVIHTVDILTASALTDDCNIKLFHIGVPFISNTFDLMSFFKNAFDLLLDFSNMLDLHFNFNTFKIQSK